MSFPLLIGGAPSRYRINQSLRFRASNSAHLTRTFGTPTSADVFTFRVITKRGRLSSAMPVFAPSTGVGEGLGFDASDRITVSRGGSILLTSNRVFRDPTAHYDILCVSDMANATASLRFRIYVNGEEITSWSTDARASFASFTVWNRNTVQHWLGYSNGYLTYYDGYMAEVHFIDGQALTPASFGQIDPSSNSWVPRRYTGTYGTNGFYLPFNDATSTTTISQDRSGNGNNWTSSGISVTAGATFDQMLDSPTNNFATLSPIRQNHATPTAGNLDIAISTLCNSATWTLTTGKWYFEVTSGTASGGYPLIGCYDTTNLGPLGGGPGQSGATPGVSYWSSGARAVNGTSTGSWGATYAAGDVIGVAIDADTGRIWFAKNGTWQAVTAQTDPDNGLNPAATMTSGQYVPGANAQVGTPSSFNFGQRPFAYTPPTGFVALNTANLSTPVIPRGDDAFQATLRTGTGASASVSSLRFAPAIVVPKSRSNATQWNWFDIVRGTGKAWVSGGGAEYTDANTLTAFNSNGYTLGSDASSRGVNINTNTYVDYAWNAGSSTVTNTSGTITSQVRANPATGISVLTYTGNGTAGATIGHGLNAAPHFITVKRLNVTNYQPVYHRNANANPQSGTLPFSGTGAFFTDNTWNNTAPGSSVFTVGGGSLVVNDNGEPFAAICMTSIPGFSLFGSYTGNGSSDGPFVWCGFRPRFVLTKRVDVSENWGIVDAARSTFNLTDLGSYANLANAEASGFAMDFTANGFKLRSAVGVNNTSGGTYIFAAFAEHPFKFANAR